MTPRNRESYTVLIVDDDPSVLATYRRLLRKAGYGTVVFQDPQAALDSVDADSGFDLILLDYKMPGMDGLTFLAELRRRECCCRCILISAFLNDDVRIQAVNLGVTRVMDKPVDVTALRRSLEELLPIAGRPPGGVTQLAG